MSPTTFLYAFIVFVVSFLFLQPIFSPSEASAAGCSEKIKGYECVDLDELKSTLHYSYYRQNSTLSIVFIAAPPNPQGWIGWGINPTGQGIAGAQVIVAFRNNNLMTTKTLDIKANNLIVPGNLSFDTWGVKAEEKGSFMKIYASLKVPNNTQTLNYIWQVGYTGVNGEILQHDSYPENLYAKGHLDLNATDYSGLIIAYLILNSVGWGILLQIGALIQRYGKRFLPFGQVWLYLHIGCQLLAFLIEIGGCAVGFHLRGVLTEVDFSLYLNLGIALLCLAFIQCSALFYRLPEDHKHIRVWRIYHYGLGCIILGIGFYYGFMGLEIFDAEEFWKQAYRSWIIIWFVVSGLLEGFTRYFCSS